MSIENTPNMAAIELSEQELDAVAGGNSTPAGFTNLFSEQATFFQQDNISNDQATHSGPDGSTAIASTDVQKILTFAVNKVDANT